MASFSGAKSAKRFDEINITPLTDIFLVLLVIMMIVAPLLENRGLTVALPTASKMASMPKTAPQATLAIIVRGDNEVLINNKRLLSMATLERQLSLLKDQFPGGVALTLAPKARHEISLQVMDAVQGAGIAKLAIIEGQ
jgi:biopolymer transport protein ExbD